MEKTREAITKLVGDTFFTAKFYRKDGSERVMQCRLGVKKHLTGGDDKRNYDPEKFNHLVVYSLDSKGYRVITLDNLIWIKARGVKIEFNQVA